MNKARFRQRLRKVQGDRCYYCGALMRFDYRNPNHPRTATLDHIVPQSVGGKWAHGAVLACRACNEDRGSTPLEEWFHALHSQERNQKDCAGNALGQDLQVHSRGGNEVHLEGSGGSEVVRDVRSSDAEWRDVARRTKEYAVGLYWQLRQPR